MHDPCSPCQMNEAYVKNEQGYSEQNDIDNRMIDSENQEYQCPPNSGLLTSTLDNDDYLSKELPRSDCENAKYPPCYLPTDADKHKIHMPEPMGPIGPWATGRVDWSPLAGLTGTRPIVDHYSITRYSTNEWKQRNKDVLDTTANSIRKSLKTENDSKNVMVRTYAITDKTQNDSTKRLTARAKDVEKWKITIERAITAQSAEISALEQERQRLKQSLSVLGMPESISTECLDRRCSRSDAELVRDGPEEELIKEIALIAEIRLVLNQTLADIGHQQIENIASRERLEYDWCDKKITFEIEGINCGYTNMSTTTLFKPGATRFPNDQSSEEYYEHFSKETLEACEACRQKSIALRGTLDAILINAARDLRNQADKVEIALATRIACMEEIRVRLENELQTTLYRLAETEKLIDKLTVGTKNMDCAMKVAQTRLSNRNQRPHIENCRDFVQKGLVDEVQTIQNGVSAMLASLQDAEDTKDKLMDTRSKLELEIMRKRRSIMLDRNRCQRLRSHFPSASALTGF